MKKLIVVISLLISGLCNAEMFPQLEVPAATAPTANSTNLDDTYNGALNALKLDTSKVQSLSGTNQAGQIESLESKISSAEFVISSTYKAASKELEGSSGFNAEWIASRAISLINRQTAAVGMEVDIVYSEAEISEKKKKAIAEEEALLKQKREYYKKYQAFLAKISPDIEKLFGYYNTGQTILTKYVENRVYPTAQIQSLFESYQGLISDMNGIYKNAGIKFDPNSNYFLIAIQNLNVFFQRMTALELGLAGLGDLSTYGVLASHMVGTGGDSPDKFVAEQGYFGVATTLFENYGSLTDRNNFLASIGSIVVTQFEAALDKLANRTAPPTQKEFKNAMLIGDVLTKLIPVVNQGKAGFKVDVYFDIASIYASYGSSLLNSLSSTDDSGEIVTTAIMTFTNAAANYSYAGKDQLQSTYQTRAANLQNAKKNSAAADADYKAGNVTAAIPLYKQAIKEYQAGGDLFDAMQLTINLAAIAGKHYIDTAQGALGSWASKNKSQLQAYSLFISSTDASGSMSDYDDLFSDLTTACQTAITNYGQALSGYQQLIQQDPDVSKSQKIAESTQQLKNSIDLLGSLTAGFAQLSSGDIAADIDTLDQLNDAQIDYAQAYQLFASADQGFSDQGVASYVPLALSTLISSSTGWTYQMLAKRHVAKVYYQQAAQISNPTIQMQYYTLAAALQQYLSASMNSALQAAIKKLSKNTKSVGQLLKQAQTNQQAAEQLPASSWQASDTTSLIYSSTASQLWDSVLNTYWSVYLLGEQDVLDDFVTAAQAYAQAYQKEVSDQFDPLLGGASILYEAYLAQLVNQQTDKATAIESTISTNMKAIFAQAQSLQQKVQAGSSSQDLSVLATATTDQVSLIGWAQRMDNAIAQQNNSLGSIGTKLSAAQQESAKLLKSSAQGGSTTYNYLPTNEAMVVTSPELKLASLYSTLGDVSFAAKNYRGAWGAYYDAYMATKAGGQQPSAKLNNNIGLSRTLTIAFEYFENVKSIGTASVPGFSGVPLSYQLTLYRQSVPGPVADAAIPGSFHGMDKAKIEQIEKQVALLTFLYNKTMDVTPDFFELNSFSALLKVIAALTKNPNDTSALSAIPKKQQENFGKVLYFWQLYGKSLSASLKSGKVQLQLMPPKGSETSFTLYQANMPIPVFIPSNSFKYYGSFPYVLYYYELALKLFAPGVAQVDVGGAEFLPGNDAQAFQQVQQAKMNAYFSRGYSFQAQVDTIYSGTTIAYLKAHKDDASIKIADYNDLYEHVKESYTQIAANYDAPLYGNNPAAVAEKTKITALIGATHQDMAEKLSVFLVGNPFDPQGYYTGYLKDITVSYENAIQLYNMPESLYAQAGKLWERAGDILVADNNNFGSLGIYGAAAYLYNKISKPDASVKAALQRVELKQASAEFYGSSTNLGNFQKLRTNPIPITLKATGQKITIDFQSLFSKYYQWKNKGDADVDANEIQKAQEIQDNYLDALIFYMGVAHDTSTLAKYADPSAFSKDTNSSSGKPPKENPVQKGAEDLVNSFTTKKDIDLTTTSSRQKLMARSDFPQVLMDGFNEFKQQVTSSDDAQTKAIAYQAMSILSNYIYSGFSKVYMTMFLGGVSTQSQLKLTSAIKAEVQNIKTPSKQYIGN